MNSTQNQNGRVARKSLAEQIDRLDSILDGLADALNESVAGAVKGAVALAVQEAVQAAVTEILLNPDLHKHLYAQAVPPAEACPAVPKVSLWAGLAGVVKGAAGTVLTAVGRARARVGEALRWTWTSLGTGLRAGGRYVTWLTRRTWLRALIVCGLARQFRKPVLVSLGVGTAVGLGCFFAGPVVASVFSGLVGFTGSLVTGLLGGLRKVLVPDDLNLA